MAKFLSCVFATLCAVFLLASPLHAGKDAMKPKKEEMKKGTMSAEDKDMMEKWMKAGAPGAEHKMFAGAVGKWDVDVQEWHKAGGEPMTSKATATIETIFDGRFMVEKFTNHMGKMTFEGKMLMGYNNLSKKYQAIWIDSMSTAIMVMEGTYDDTKKEFTSSGKFIDPMDGQEKTMLLTGHMVDDNTRVHEFYTQGADGKQMKIMEMTYHRSK